VPARLLSLDVFRGLTIAAMVMVNNQTGAGAYTQLRHASWHGWTFTDLVFPFFLWIVGVAMTLSTAKRIELGATKRELIVHALQRFALIFAVGLFLNAFPHFDLASLRILGVLQRIAICYLIGFLIYLFTGVRGRVMATLGFLAVYTIVMHSGGYERATNFSNWLDGVILGAHNYGPSGTWDPEGIFSTLPAVATCLMGILTGDLLRASLSMAEKTAWMFFSGNVLFLLGTILNPLQPINKPIWTGSYALLTAGLALMVFGACYWLVDVHNRRGAWTRPLIIFGMNAMAVYVFHGLLARLLGMWRIGDVSARRIHSDFFAGLTDPANASLLYSLCHVLASFLFAWFLFRRKWFLKF
jgi:predicted acyltransferase